MLARRQKQARAGVDAAQAERTKAITDHASQVGRLEELQRLRDAEDLATAENRLRDATDRHAAVPVPERIVTEAEVATAQNAKTSGEIGSRRDRARDPADARRARAGGRRRCARAAA